MTTEVRKEKQERDTAAELLKIALAEAQQAIRSYDSKAQICAIGYLFSLNLVLGINEVIWPESGPSIGVVAVGWGVLIFPMLLFGYVLYPTRKSISPGKDISRDIQKVLYIRQERHKTVKEIMNAALNADKLDEFAFELQQASELRDRKRARFVRALAAAAGALFIMFSLHIMAVFYLFSWE